MKLTGRLIPLAAAVLLSDPLAYAQQLVIYPSKGQTAEQQSKDHRAKLEHPPSFASTSSARL